MDAFLAAINPVKAVYHAILSSLLGAFVEDFTRRDFDVSIMSGRARFSNLKLKADALAGLQLPIAVSEGVLESLVLVVPYTREVLFQLLFRGGDDVRAIQMEPIELRLKRIRVVVKPLESLDVLPANAAQVMTGLVSFCMCSSEHLAPPSFLRLRPTPSRRSSRP